MLLGKRRCCFLKEVYLLILFGKEGCCFSGYQLIAILKNHAASDILRNTSAILEEKLINKEELIFDSFGFSPILQ